MKKHAQRDILQKVIRAVAIANPLFVYSEIICVCLQVELLTEVPWQSCSEGVCVCVCVCGGGVPEV